MVSFTVSSQFMLNDSIINVGQPLGMTLLDFIRYNQDLVGTKIGCREGDCGACTVLIGEPDSSGQVRYHNIVSCLTPLGNVLGCHVVTIEGLNMTQLSPIQKLIVDHGGTQCGFCTVGFIVSLTGYVLSYPIRSGNVIESIDGNICRCTGYKSIEKAAIELESLLDTLSTNNWIQILVDQKFIPTYFLTVQDVVSNLVVDYFEKESYQMIGGGTDLYVQQADHLIDLELIHTYRGEEVKVIENDGLVTCNANITASEFSNNPILTKYIPNFRQYFELIASTPIRNMATLAGNIVNASPIADFVSMLLVFDANLHLDTGRRIKLSQFYSDYKTFDLRENEKITHISFKLEPGLKFNFEKVSKRKLLDIASVNTSILLVENDNIVSKCKISIGGVYPYPLYLSSSTYLEGKPVTVDGIRELIYMIQNEIKPISDIRGSIRYKRLLARQLVMAHFMVLFPWLEKDLMEVIQ